MDRRTLRRLVNEWLRRLGLRGWRVDIVLAPHTVFEATHGAGTYCADVTPDPQHQLALMRVLCRKDMEKRGLSIDAIEETLVHELLHVRLDPMSHLSNDAAFEIGLDTLAEELVRLVRIERARQ